MEKRFVTITRSVGQPWGINLKKVDNKFIVESVNDSGPGHCLEKGDVIESINNVPLNSLSSADIKPFFDAILTANVWYFRKVISIINLLDDDEEDQNINSNSGTFYAHDDDFWSDFPSEALDEDDDHDHFSRPHNNSHYLSSFGSRYEELPHRNNPVIARPIGFRTAQRSNEPVVIDLISDDEDPPPPTPPQQAAQAVTNSVQSQLPSEYRPQTESNNESSRVPSIPKKQSKDTPSRTHIGSIKIKQEFEPKKFGEANFGDEVIEVMPEAPPSPPTVDIDAEASSSKGGKRKFGEAFANDEDDEIQFVGGNMQVAADMPHQREACPRCPFERYKQVSNNEKFCSNCYCFICEVKASECMEWKAHCHAHCKDIKWKKLRDTNNIPILRLMSPAQKSAFLAKYRSALNAVEESRYSDDEYDSWESEDEYYSYSDGNYATNNAFTESVAAAKVFLAKPDLSATEYLDCTALVLNAIRLVSYSRTEAVIDLSLSWITHTNFTQQFNDLLVQQLNRRGYPRINWLTGLANLIVKAKVDPQAALLLPPEVNNLPDRSFVKVIRKLSGIVPAHHLRTIIDRHPGSYLIPELIFEYFRSNEHGLHQLVNDYLSKANLQSVATNLREYGRRMESGTDLQPRPILILICQFLDSNRSPKSSPRSIEATEGMISILLHLLLKNVLKSITIPQAHEVIEKMIQQSAISVLIENPNLQIKTWAENRITTYSQQSNAAMEELELVLIVTMIVLQDLIRKINYGWNNIQTWDQKQFEDQLKTIIPSDSLKISVILANLCAQWSLSPLCGKYEEASFVLACEFTKKYFREDESKYSMELISQFHPTIFEELSRIPSMEYVSRSPDLGVLMQFHIHLNPAHLEGMTVDETEKTITVEYPSRESFLKDLYKPSQSSSAQSRKALGQSLADSEAEKLYNWLGRYYFQETRNNLSEFLKSCETYFAVALKGVLISTWRSIAVGETLRRMSRFRHFLEEVAIKDLLDFPKIAGCRLICKMRKNCDPHEVQGLVAGIVETKAFAINLVKEYINYRMLPDISFYSELETELSKLFCCIYPINQPQEQFHQILWEHLCKPYLKAFVTHSSYVDPDMSVYLMLEMWDMMQRNGLHSLHLLSNVKLSDLQWPLNQIVPNLQRLMNIVERSLVSKNVAMKAINFPHSVLAKLFEFSNYSQITSLIQDRSLIALKVLSMHENVNTISANSANSEDMSVILQSPHHQALKQIFQKVKGDIAAQVKKLLPTQTTNGNLLYYFFASLYLGLFDCAQLLLPHIPESFRGQAEVDPSYTLVFHHSFRDYESFEDFFFYIIFMNLSEVQLDGAAQVCMERLRILFSNVVSAGAKKKSYDEIFARFQIIIENPNYPGSQKSYISEAIFYYHYNEQSMKTFHQILTSSFDSKEQLTRFNRVKQWLEQVQQKRKTERKSQLAKVSSSAVDSSSAYPSSSATMAIDRSNRTKERYRTADHYAILSYLVHPIELFQMLVQEFTKERETVQQLLVRNPQFSILSDSTDSSNQSIYYECEKILLVALRKSKLFFTESVALRDVVTFFFNGILFLKHSALEIRKKFLSSLDKQYFRVQSNLLPEETRFQLEFLRIYRKILNKINGSIPGMSSSTPSKSTPQENSSSSATTSTAMDLVEIDLNECLDTSSPTMAAPEKTLSQMLQESFQLLSQKYQQSYQFYKNQMIDCFLFPEDPNSTFQLLLENRVFALIPVYLHQLEASNHPQQKTLSVMIEKVTTNLTMLFQSIQFHHFLPANTSGMPANGTRQTQEKLCLQEFLNNPESLLLQLFVYLSELQYRYLSRWDSIHERDENYAFISDFSIVAYHNCRKILKDVIIQFTKTIQSYFPNEPCLKAFLPCLHDFCSSAVQFITEYMKKDSRVTTPAAAVCDPILTKIFSLSKKRMHYSAVLEYLQMIFTLLIEQRHSGMQIIPIHLFKNPNYYQKFMDNILMYPLMIDFLQTETSFREELLSKGLLSIKASNKSEKELNYVTNTFSKLFDGYGAIAISAVGKGFILYFLGYIPNELTTYHKYSFVEEADENVSKISASNVTSTASIEKNTASNEKTIAVEDDETIATYSIDNLPQLENFYCVEETDRQRLVNRSNSGPIRVDKRLMLQEPPESSHFGQLYGGFRYHSSRYGYNPPPVIRAESNPIVKLLRKVLTHSISMNEKISASQVQRLDQYFILLLEKFEIDTFQTLVQELYEIEIELYPYFLSLFFALFQKMLLQKVIRAFTFLPFFITCYRNHYALVTTHNSKSTSNTNNRFDRLLAQTIYQINTKKLCNYFSRCYAQTFDSELTTTSPSVINSLPMDRIMEIPELMELFTSFGNASFQDVSLNSLARRRPVLQLLAKAYARKGDMQTMQDFTGKLLKTFEQVVMFCRSHTMDKNKKVNLTEIVHMFRNCFGELAARNPEVRVSVNQKKTELMKILKSKKAVLTIFQEL